MSEVDIKVTVDCFEMPRRLETKRKLISHKMSNKATTLQMAHKWADVDLTCSRLLMLTFPRKLSTLFLSDGIPPEFGGKFGLDGPKKEQHRIDFYEKTDINLDLPLVVGDVLKDDILQS